jgi:methyltransferase (TIGR00027 family)
MANPEISHISDTAFWIAGYRAQESARPDAVFRDHLAATLAGERGLRIADTTPSRKAMAFAMVVRTVAIDRLVEHAVELGVDLVLNLGAGLDTRPYRMKLPNALRWVEVDYPDLIQFKNEKLSGEIPVCHLERIGCDLSHAEERRALLSRIGAECKTALVITEGVIGYLTPEQAAELSSDLHSVPTFRYWIQDFARGGLRRVGRSKLTRKIKNTPVQFHVPDPLAFFEQQGWKVERIAQMFDEADRIGRKMPLLLPWSLLFYAMPKTARRWGNNAFGYVMFGK